MCFKQRFLCPLYSYSYFFSAREFCHSLQPVSNWFVRCFPGPMKQQAVWRQTFKILRRIQHLNQCYCFDSKLNSSSIFNCIRIKQFCLLYHLNLVIFTLHQALSQVSGDVEHLSVLCCSSKWRWALAPVSISIQSWLYSESTNPSFKHLLPWLYLLQLLGADLQVNVILSTANIDIMGPSAALQHLKRRLHKRWTQAFYCSAQWANKKQRVLWMGKENCFFWGYYLFWG